MQGTANFAKLLALLKV